jgi:acetyl/propionyl-CoA carboxylase alpha subunit
MKFALGPDILELLPGENDTFWTYSLNGQSGTVNAVEVEPGTYSILLNGNSYEVRTGSLGDGGTWVDIAGLRQQLDLRDPRNSRPGNGTAQRGGQATVKVPMPGKVVRILVAEGDPVEAGQGLAVVEAMKMQNEMKAPRTGVIRTIKVKEGATVAAGDSLMVVE